MSSYSDDYDVSTSDEVDYSDDGYSGGGGGSATNQARQFASQAAPLAAAATSTQNLPRRSGAGRSDLLLNILFFCLFVSLIGVSAAAIRQIISIRDNGTDQDRAQGCFVAAYQIYRLVIGILVVASVGAVHTLIALILSGIKKLPAGRYCLTFCILPHAVVLITLGIIVIAWGSPSNSVQVGASAWDNCRGVHPYQLAFSSGAVATAFGGFILLFGPGCALVAIIEDIRNNPRVVQAQQIVTGPGAQLAAQAAGQAASRAGLPLPGALSSATSCSTSYDYSGGYSGGDYSGDYSGYDA